MMMAMIKVWTQKLLDIVFPQLCLSCGRNLTAPEEKEFKICSFCSNQIKVVNGAYCPICSRRLPELLKTCHPQTQFILLAVTSYGLKPVQELIQTLKYKKLASALKPWPSLIKNYLSALPDLKIDQTKTIIIPVPIHKSKERQRTFNQSELLAKLLARIFKDYYRLDQELPVVPALSKIKTTLSQTECPDYKTRAKNVAGSLVAVKPALIQDKNVILVDDVFTSGATMNEAARILKEAGARKIFGFVLAKA